MVVVSIVTRGLFVNARSSRLIWRTQIGMQARYRVKGWKVILLNCSKIFDDR